MAGAITTYQELISAIAQRLPAHLRALIPQYISFAETRFNRRLKLQQQEQRATASINSQYFALPVSSTAPNYLGLRNIQVNVSRPYPIYYITPEILDRKYSGEVGPPKAYTLIANQFQFAPIPDGTYTIEITYWEKIPALSAVAPTNFLLDTWPDLYLCAALAEALYANPYETPPALEQYPQHCERLLEHVEAHDQFARFAGYPLSVRLSGTVI